MSLIMRCITNIKMVSGVPEDEVVNVWHFGYTGVGGIEDAMDDVEQRLQTFYGAVAGLWPTTVQGDVTYRHYNLGDPLPRIPQRTSVFHHTPGPNLPQPSETAICLSFKSFPEPGINPQSLRGRIFFGPLAKDAGTIDANGRVHATAYNTIADAWEDMVGAISGNTAVQGIYSPTRDAGGDTLEESFRAALTCWVDNAFDTQRRRGLAPTVRVERTVS